MVRLVLIGLCVFLFAGCKIFRHSNESYQATAVRDSVNLLLEESQVIKTGVFRRDETLYSLLARGFDSIRILPDGSVEAFGMNGVLDVWRSMVRSNDSLKIDSAGGRLELITSRDSSRVDYAKEKSYEANPTTWFNWWWILVLGAVVVICFRFFIR